MVATMKIQRYYSSVREEVSQLSEDANTLLERQDYVGFFMGCGPNYVRGIRRAQEVTAVFSFQSTSSSSAKEFAGAFKITTPFGGGGKSKASSSKFASMNSSMKITIQGFGMGLNQDGAGTLVATTLEEYQQVMKFAFKSFTQNEDSPNIGMIFGIEVVPWVNNVSFQVAAQVHDENVELPLPRSLIPRAHLKTDKKVTDGFVSLTNRTLYECKELTFVIDRYGYCCEIDALYDYTNKTYVTEGFDDDAILDLRICRPIRSLDKSLVKDNMSTNGEFVANLDSIARYRLNQISTIERCIMDAKSIPDRYQYNILKTQDMVKYDSGTIDPKFTLAELRRAVDPLGDFSLVIHLGKELDEWMTMYFSPCMAAIFGSNVGTTPGTDPQYFLAYPWHVHDECLKLTCLTTNMRWDRAVGGCVPSLMVGTGGEDYSNGETQCAYDTELNDAATETCKYNTTVLQKYHTEVNGCWTDTLPDSNAIEYYVNNYCMPQLTDEKAEEDAIAVIEAGKTLAGTSSYCGVFVPP